MTDQARDDQIRAEINEAVAKAGLSELPPHSSDDLESMALAMQAISERQAIREAIVRSYRHRDKEERISDSAFLCWKVGDLKFYLVESPMHAEYERMKVQHPDLYRSLRQIFQGRYNGYVQFPKTPGISQGYSGIYRYAQVHGGITFFEDLWDGSVIYGFDTAHAQSSEMGEIINDLGWLMSECEAMARNIQICARFEAYYLRAEGDENKLVRVLERMNRFMPIDPTSNLGTMLSFMSGNL